MYKHAVHGWLKHLDFIVLDELCLVSSLILAIGLDAFPERLQSATFYYFLLNAVLVNSFVAIALDTMDNVLYRGYYKELAATFRHIFYFIVFFVALMYLQNNQAVFITEVGVSAVLPYFFSSYAVRLVWKRLLRRKPLGKGARQHILIVTSSQAAPEILKRMTRASFERYQVTGLVMVDRDIKGESVGGVPVVANLSDAAEYLCREWTDEVFFFKVSLDERCADLLEKCREMALTVHLYLALQGVNEGKQTVEHIAGYEVLTANINMMSAGDAFLKRSFDIVAGLLGSLVTLALMAAIAPALKKASPGPLLFKQTRIGENGRKFTMYKIRSMYMDAEERKAHYAADNAHADGMMFKMDFDPRVIGNQVLPDGTRKKGIGDFIRRTSLDEFPQFFNVLKGDMSIVGTRPPTLDEWEKYEFHHRARMSVKPGLTGLWQINRDKDHMPFDEVVKLDTEYIATWSIGKDLRIIAQTGVAIFRELMGRNDAAPEKPQYKA